jgi:hypothetical protein
MAKLRALQQTHLSRENCADFAPLQTQEARDLASNLTTSPPDTYESFLSRCVRVHSESRTDRLTGNASLLDSPQES